MDTPRCRRCRELGDVCEVSRGIPARISNVPAAPDASSPLLPAVVEEEIVMRPVKDSVADLGSSAAGSGRIARQLYEIWTTLDWHRNNEDCQVINRIGAYLKFTALFIRSGFPVRGFFQARTAAMAEAALLQDFLDRDD